MLLVFHNRVCGETLIRDTYHAYPACDARCPAMPPKQPFSAERAQDFGDLAVVKATESIGQDGLLPGIVLSCAYRGVATPDGGFDPDGHITARTTLVYAWSVTGESFEEAHDNQVRAKDAAKRGVPFPAIWTTALTCLQMSSVVETALQAARQESEAIEVNCQFLGAAS